MQLGLPEGELDPDAESGAVVHAALAGLPTRELTDEEQDTVRHYRTLEDDILRSWYRHADEPLTVHRELRLWHKFMSPKFDRIMLTELETSGQADVIYIHGSRALIIDAKAARKAVTNEAENLQLRHLAALLAINHPELDEITVALAQHWSKNNPPCVYRLTDLALAITDLEEDVENDYDPSFQPTPGTEQCEYCRAKAICPAFLASSLPAPLDPMPTPERITEAIASLPGSRLGPFLGLVRLAASVAEKEARERLTKGNIVDGWTLKPGRETETISDPTTCYNRFMSRGGTPEQFMAAVKVTKGKLKEGLKVATGAKGKQLDEELDRLLSGITESKVSKPVLEAA